MSAVALEQVSKSFTPERQFRRRARGSGVQALCKVDLSVEPGELVAVVGPSGCGKTTMLRLIAGLERPTSGTIRIGERVVNDVAPRDRDIAMVFQSFALYPHMSVYRNLAFGLKMRGEARPEIAERIGEVAEMLGISHLLDRRPGQLSGGEQQRVAVGRAVVRKPSVFLLDEPLSNLDAQLRMRMRFELAALLRRLRITTIYVTHDQEEAMTLGDRIVVMRHGMVQQTDAPMEVYRRPANRFVAEFIGSPGMNFIEGRIESNGMANCFVGPDCRVPVAPDHDVEPIENGTAAALGFRPHHLILGINAIELPKKPDSKRTTAGIASADDSRIPLGRARISRLEILGDVTNMHLRTESGKPLVARLSTECEWVSTAIKSQTNPRDPLARAASADPAQWVWIEVDRSKVHLFAAGVDGKRLA